MLVERKRDSAANALLALSFAANAASSPKNLVRSGYIESPGIQLMSRMMSKRKEAERNLDNPRVVSRGSKTFKEFVESYLIEGQSREEAEKKRLAKPNPNEWRVRNTGGGNWTTKRKSAISSQGKRRKTRLNPLTKQELEGQAKRTLRKNPTELSAIAYDREQDAKKKQKEAKRRLTKETGIKHVEDHSQPLQQDKRKPENQKRFEKITPGDVASNIQVTSEPKNLRKGSRPPKKGERGYGTTRSGAIKQSLDKAERFSNKLDKLIATIRNNK